jgi:probable rRNA maturation factor
VQITIINQQKKAPVSKRATKAVVLKTLNILNPVRNTNLPTGKREISKGVKSHLTGELTVVYTDNRTIQELNYRFLGKRLPTDVLCFDLSKGKGLVADIVISVEKAQENSRLFKTSVSQEIRLYLIHAILHLAGFKDKRAKDRIRMHREALRILNKI